MIDNGTWLVVEVKSNIRELLRSIVDNILLKERTLIEMINDGLKKYSTIEYS